MNILYERIIWVIVCVIAVGISVLWLEHRGAQNCVASDTRAATAQTTQTATAEGKAAGEVKVEANEYHEAVSQPVTGAPVVRVCPAAVAPHPREVLPAAAPGPEPDATARVREADQGQSWDSTPVVTAGRDADAQVRLLQAYVRDVCIAPH